MKEEVLGGKKLHRPLIINRKELVITVEVIKVSSKS